MEMKNRDGFNVLMALNKEQGPKLGDHVIKSRDDPAALKKSRFAGSGAVGPRLSALMGGSAARAAREARRGGAGPASAPQQWRARARHIDAFTLYIHGHCKEGRCAPSRCLAEDLSPT